MARLEASHACLQASHAWLELTFLDHALRIAVDQTANTSPQNPHLLVELGDLLRTIRFLAHLAKAPIVLVDHALRGFQNSSDLLPDQRLQAITPNGSAVAHRRPAEPVGITSDAAVVAQVTFRPILPVPWGGLAVVCVAASTADGQALHK